MAPKPRRPAPLAASEEPAHGPDPAKELLWARPGFLVRRLHQIHVAMFFEECKSQSITPVQYGVLTALSARPGLDQTSLGQEVGLDRSTTADVVRRLAERGLIERRAHPTDRRARQVNLTEQGHTMVETLRVGMARAQERMLEPLQPAERAMFMQWLTVLVEANNQYSRTVLRIV